MGATLPAMERVLAALRSAGASIAALYAANTFGAVLGVLGDGVLARAAARPRAHAPASAPR